MEVAFLDDGIGGADVSQYVSFNFCASLKDCYIQVWVDRFSYIAAPKYLIN